MAIVWITGARGFIGRHLSRFLSASGHTVLGVGYGHWPQQEAAASGVSCWVNGEVNGTHCRALRSASERPDVVFHLAGGSAVGPSFSTPLEDFRRTVNSTAQLLDWARTEAVRPRIVVVSSAAVYGSRFEAPILEESSPAPVSPYGFHKLMMEDLCRSYARNFEISIAVARLFSVYGPGLSKQLIWDVCSKLEKDSESLTLDGTGEEIRDWLHIDDVVRLLWHLKEYCSPKCPAFNGGTGAGTSTRTIAELICTNWPTTTEPRFSGRSRPGDPRSLVADTAAMRETGFSPHKSVDQGIRETVHWFRASRQIGDV